MKILIAAGGTGGHVFPALAVAEHLQAAGHSVAFAGAPDSFESRVVPTRGFTLLPVRVIGLRGAGLARVLRAPWVLAVALWDALRAMRVFRPSAILGMGGFVAGPVGIAAWITRRPLLIHEQNAHAGMTNRLLGHVARQRLEAFPGSLPSARVVGNPVRAGFAAVPEPSVRLAGRDGVSRLLVVGGSQGARVLNERVPEAVARLPLELRPSIRHQAGRTLNVAQHHYAAYGLTADIVEFIDDMPQAYAWADLVICRAGASTVAELAAAGCASILVPYPHAVDDHQRANAGYLVDRGAARLIGQHELTPERLAAELSRLLGDRKTLLAMAQHARQAAWPDAAGAIARACIENARLAS